MPPVRPPVWNRVFLLLVVPAVLTCSGDGNNSTDPDPLPATIQLLAPTGGEVLDGGALTIRWQSQNATSQTVAIRLSNNSGASFSEVIASGLGHTASYDWDVSDRVDESTYRIQVDLISGSQTVVASAASESDFTIDNPATIQLLAPLGGETWEGVQTIQWQSQNAATETATLLLSANSGGAFAETVATGLGHSASHQWDVSGVPDGTAYRIRVDLLDGSQSVVASAESESDFTIDNPEPRLLLTDIDFADPALRERVLGTGKTYADEVTVLKARDLGILDLSGIEFLTSLDTLRLDENPIVDLSPLSSLGSLQVLDLDGCSITDLAPLSGLVELKDLEVSRNQIADFGPLSALTGLLELSIGTNPATDLTPLTTLSSLTYLHASYIKPESLAPVGTLTTLETLFFQGSGLTDINDLAGLVNLKSLNVPNNDLVSIAPVAGMDRLEKLAAFSNRIISLAPLEDLTGLVNLSMSGNPIADFLALPNLVNLIHLDLAGTGFSDLALLDGMTQMRELYLGSNGLIDIAPLAQFAELRSLYLYGNSIADISPLSVLQHLEDLDFGRSNVTDVSSLANLTTLEYLRASDNDVTAGVAALVTLVSARTIDLAGNNQIPCADLDALEAALGAGVVTRPAACVVPDISTGPPPETGSEGFGR